MGEGMSLGNPPKAGRTKEQRIKACANVVMCSINDGANNAAPVRDLTAIVYELRKLRLVRKRAYRFFHSIVLGYQFKITTTTVSHSSKECTSGL